MILVLALALLIPYIWMGKLTTKGLLDAERSRSNVLLERHFRLKGTGQTLSALDEAGRPLDPNDGEISWIRFTEDVNGLPELTEETKEEIEKTEQGVKKDSTANPLEKTDLKVGFVYVGPIGDHGWTYRHDVGRLAIEQALGQGG